jgi:GNAT superfamily N-acetyltransferase
MNDSDAAVRIRPALAADTPYFYEICLKTGDAGKDASALFFDPFLLGHYFAAPYLFFPQGVCFAAEYQFRPQGYIIAVPDTGAFNRWMEETWLPPLRRQYPLPFPPQRLRSETESRLMMTIRGSHLPPEPPAPWLAAYPAHLHINLLPEIQGRGTGRLLMDTLCAELIRCGVPGVHLGVNARNSSAMAFYRKMGFSVLQEESWGPVMGKALNAGGKIDKSG